MLSTSRKTAALALTMAVLVPLYWFSEFGLFMERKFFPPATDVFRWGDAFTLVIMLLAIALLVSCRKSLGQHVQHQVTRFAAITLTAILSLSCLLFTAVRTVEVFATSPPTFDAYHPVSFIMLAVSVTGLISASLLGLSLQALEKRIASPVKLAGLMLFIAVIAPFLSLGMLLPVAPVLVSLALVSLAFHSWQAESRVDLI
ncbi:MAG: hypothetical protein LAT77_02735 [Aliidiomarina sp.]|uniref:hypothetical protein n=1 Tax=Aliidiomarina sp. TaxID=1872439 RepID=UPI0025B92E0A|nr:hypothetical protein [Aliidiomarina sp.]MCH8500809.1 hypothetical protein [Aliidiomarina sp.]